MQEFTVKFIPGKARAKVRKGTDLLTAAVKAGVILNAPCGGNGTCGKCKVMIAKREVLACQVLVESDLTVEIPKSSLAIHEKSEARPEEFTRGVVLAREKTVKFSPMVKKVYVELAGPTEDDATGDLERLCNKIAEKCDHIAVSTKVANVRHLSEVLRESDFKVTAVIAYKDSSAEIIAIEPGDTVKDNFGFAFDIGTTTVAGQLISMNTGAVSGSRIAFNKQSGYGSDVITRIIYASNPEGLDKLNDAVLSNINDIVEDLSVTNRVNLANVYSFMFAGNMTMMHLLLKIDPSNIRKPPYVPAAASFEMIPSAEIGVEAHPKAIAAFAPGVSTYVGGDIVAGVLATGLSESGDLSLLIDIGTNGEIVLGNNEWMIGTAASAGPAFEGSGLKDGMKAVAGAIDRVMIDDKLSVKIGVIGNGKPKGICGSGYIDLLCQMRDRGVIGKDGRINRSLKSKRIRRSGDNYEFVVACECDTDTEKDVAIQDDDIENLKRSKGAIYSAIIALLNKVGKDIAEVKKIYIAGGFGNYLNIENAVRIGLLPDVKRDVYEFVGNSSLAGARMALTSREFYGRLGAVASGITYLDLSSEPGYMDEYIAALFFPHTDKGRFPSVR